MNTPTILAEGIDLRCYDGLDEANAFLKTLDSGRAGVAITLSGELVPGKVNAAILAGEPIGEIIARQSDKSIQRMAVVTMSSYFDQRHATFLSKSIMVAIASARGMTEAASSEGLPKDSLPWGDIGRMSDAGMALVVELDEVIGFPVVRQDSPVRRNAAEPARIL